jgi:germination protein M
MTARARGTGRSRLFWAACAALLVLVAGIVVVRVVERQRGEAEPPAAVESAVPDTAGADAGTRSVQLVFGSGDARSLVSEQRQLPSSDHLEDELRAAMQALCAGPLTRGAVATLPRGTRVLGVFYDERKGAVLVDFSRELRERHPGGSAAERATVDAILRTIALNFPEVRACTLLIEGTQAETLAGHVALDRPLDPRRWL